MRQNYNRQGPHLARQITRYAHVHAPEVEYISKGKARTRYEFGVKVSIATTRKEGVVVGTRSMPGTPYDGHTLGEAIEQASIVSEVRPAMVMP